MTVSIDADRLWQSIMDIARIGPTPEGGSCRLALSPEDAEARALLLRWSNKLNLRFEQDAIGNMFLRRQGSDDTAPAVAFGSHLDTVPTGGRFDGVFGVLGGLEVIRALDTAGTATRAPLELVNWTNEEGSRFRPAMMGSRVHATDMTLEDALGITDDNGISVRDALRDTGQAGPLVPSPRGWACWLEAHIEQGPVMEATGADIGIVTGTVHARYFQLTVTGEPSHVGPTTMDRRRDSLAATAEIILAVERIALAAEPEGRASATWIENYPNARGNVANITRLHCDVRHARPERAIAMERELRTALDAISDRRRVSIAVHPYATFGPIAFDPALGSLLRDKAQHRQLATRDMIAAAGHDSVLIAPLCPSAMLFIPSVDGITHNPREYSTKEQVAHGAQVLLDAVLTLAS
jgi:beta-ureidopropionase / N-carbamoyl-L-amino-acid hydrolase